MPVGEVLRRGGPLPPPSSNSLGITLPGAGRMVCVYTCVYVRMNHLSCMYVSIHSVILLLHSRDEPRAPGLNFIPRSVFSITQDANVTASFGLHSPALCW